MLQYRRKVYLEQANDERAVARPHRNSERHRARRAERAKNGNSARADAGSIGPSALDREDRDAQT